MIPRILFALVCLAAYCHPALAQDYPKFKITAYDTSSKGYYFMGPIKTGKGPAGKPGFMILDKKGDVVYYKTLPKTVSVFDFKIQPNGLMSFTYNNNYYYLMDSTFKIVDSVQCKNGLITDIHDMQILKDGHYLLMGSEFVHKDLSAYPYFNRNGSPGSKNANVICGVVQELDENKNVVFEWHAKDYLDFSDVDPFYLNSPDGVDWTHMNAVAQDTDGNILVSSRHLNEVTKINRKDSSVIWRFGGKRNMFAFINDSSGFLGQHDIRRIDNGNFTLFDNGRAANPFHTASGKEYQLDEKNHKATLVWSYIENPTAYSSGTGNVERLPNGASLIDYGLFSGGHLVFNVVNAAGDKSFELKFDDSLITYRAFNYPELPWWLHRPKITCATLNGKFYLQTTKPYTKYIWSTGDTTQAMEVKKADTISVFVADGNGGFISSQPFIVSSHTDPCGISGLQKQNAGPVFTIYPDPVKDNLLIRFPYDQYKEMNFEIADMTGKRVLGSRLSAFNGIATVDVSLLPKGIYLLKAGGIEKKFVKN